MEEVGAERGRGQDQRGGNWGDGGDAGGQHHDRSAGCDGENDRAGDGGQRSQHRDADQPFGQHERPPAQVQPQAQGSHVDRDEQRTEVEEHVAGGRQRASQGPSAGQEAAGECAHEGHLRPLGKPVPADGDEDRGRGQEQEGTGGSHPRRPRPAPVGWIGRHRSAGHASTVPEASSRSHPGHPPATSGGTPAELKRLEGDEAHQAHAQGEGDVPGA